MLNNNKYEKKQNFLHQEDQSAQVEYHSHQGLYAGNPQEVVELVSAYFTNIQSQKPQRRSHSAKYAIGPFLRQFIHVYLPSYCSIVPVTVYFAKLTPTRPIFLADSSPVAGDLLDDCRSPTKNVWVRNLLLREIRGLTFQ